MLQRFYGYTKSADESIDKMSSALKQFSDEIYDLAPEARPSEISRAAVIMNACEGEEYEMAKYTLGQADVLTSALAVEQLRSVEQDLHSQNSANVAKGNRGKSGQRGRSNRSFDKSNIECYECYEMGHFRNECLKKKGMNADKSERNSTSKNKRKTSGKLQKNLSKRKEKAAVTSEEPADDGDDDYIKERVWMAQHRNEKAKGWLLDSAATRHMTPQRDLFIDFHHQDGEVEFGNAGLLSVAGWGKIRIPVGRHMQTLVDVLYVPNMSENLLSIHALDKRGFQVIFGTGRVQIIDGRTP